MKRRSRDVVPYSRDYRRPPRWRKNSTRRRSPRRTQRRVILWSLAIVLAVMVGPGLDAASLVWRKSEGCAVWMVVDGDTVKAWCFGSGARTIRLVGFDTPEMRGRCLTETAKAWRATYALRFGIWRAGTATVVLSGRDDRYGRALGQLRLDGTDVAEMLVQAGLARPYAGGRRDGWCGRGA